MMQKNNVQIPRFFYRDTQKASGNPEGTRLGKGLQTDGLYPPFYFLWCHGDGKAVACGGNAALQGRNDGFNGKNHAPHFSIIVCGLN